MHVPHFNVLLNDVTPSALVALKRVWHLCTRRKAPTVPHFNTCHGMSRLPAWEVFDSSRWGEPDIARMSACYY